MRTSSLKRQVVVACVLFTIILTTAIGISGYFQYRKSIMTKYYDYADTIVNLAKSSFEANGMAQLIRDGKMGEGYDNTRKYLNNLKENSDIAYVYAVYYPDADDPDSLSFVINGATTKELLGVPEGQVYSYMGERVTEGGFEDAVKEAYYDSYKNKDTSFRYYENVTPEYGHMLSVYRLLLDEKGEPSCLLNVDLDVSDIENTMNMYVLRMVAIAIIFMVVLLFIFMEFIDRYVTIPITEIASNTDNFVMQLQDNTEPEDLTFKEVKIYLGNDIGKLYLNLRKMADSIKDYMINLQSVTKEGERIGTELQVATKMQKELLPKIFPLNRSRNEFDVYGYIKPAKEVGGDFYDYFFVDDDHFAMVIADVSGNGVPAALFMVIAKTLIKNQIQTTGLDDLSGSLSVVSDKLCESNGGDLFVTVWLAIIDLKTGDGVSVNAGHEHPAVRRKNGKFELIKYSHSPAVAVMEGIKYNENKFHMEPGDALYMYTDGVTEAPNSHFDLFGEGRLIEALNKEPDVSLEKICHNVVDDINGFAGEMAQADDMTMLGFLYKGTTDTE